jgi:hypothetical protein
VSRYRNDIYHRRFWWGKRTGKNLNCKTEADGKIIIQQNLKEKDERLEIYTIKLGMGNGGGQY